VQQAGKRQRGRPKLYGEKIKLKDLFSSCLSKFSEVQSPFQGEDGVKVRYYCMDLLWRPIGRLARFVLVVHPTKGRWILIGTDLMLDPVRMITLYGLRFRIELCFKQAIYLVGAFAYRFWFKMMKKNSRGSGDFYLHRESARVRQKIMNKIRAYNLHVQLGLIALGLLQWLSLSLPKLAWLHFGSWLRTMNTTAHPSELVTATAMRNTLPDFLMGLPQGHDLAKFLEDKIDLDRMPHLRATG